MSAPMGPPPPRAAAAAEGEAELPVPESTTEATVVAAAPAPSSGKDESEKQVSESGNFDDKRTGPEGNSSEVSKCVDDSVNGSSSEGEGKREQRSNNAAVPYTIPPWSGAPCHSFFLEVLKDGAIVGQFDVAKKGAYMFGRVDLCDFVLEHPTISRFHAVLQFRSDGGAYLYDLGSTHGTFINKNQVKKRVYVDIHVGDVVRFGHSSRLYIFQGPQDLMPQEADLKSIRKAKIHQDMQDMEASLLRAKLEASRADGISWGMGEDAVEDDEDEVDEITWQTYKGQLTEKQEKTKEKVIKRLQKISHMKKEIDAIRAKDISQGGLTQGQQTQIARNEQRISQIMEELENLEETLNDSIRESVGARSGKLAHGKKMGNMEEFEDLLSDDDDFYDRTKKSSKQKSDSKSVETADSLLDKKELLVKEIEDKEKLLTDDNKQLEETNNGVNAEDALDAYMSAVSSQLVLDAKEKIHKELSELRTELDRVLYLLRVADPTGEAPRRRESSDQKGNTVVNKTSASDAGNGLSLPKEQNSNPTSEKSRSSEPEAPQVQAKDKAGANPEPDTKMEEAETNAEASSQPSFFTVTKPQWLGAVEDRAPQETPQAAPADQQETGEEFVDYKDRQTMLAPSLEAAAAGLLIRKRKPVQSASENTDSEEASASQFKAEDAVALLLKHSRGHHAWDEDTEAATKKPKRVLGPEKPSVATDPDYDSSWVPPQGQSGDGRTSLNDRFGY